MSPALQNYIASGGRTAAAPINPIEAQNIQARTAQTQQQTQGLQLEQEIQRRMLRDQDIGQRAYVNTDWSKPSAEQDAEEYMIRNGMTLKGIMDYRMATATYRKTLSGAQKEDLENQQTVNGMKADAFNAYLNAKQEDKAAVWPTVADRLNRFGANYDRNTAPPDQLLQAGLALNEHQSVLLENQLKQQQAQTSAAQAKEAGAKTKETEQKTTEEAAQIQRAQTARENPTEANLLAAMTPKEQAEYKIQKGGLEERVQALKESMARHQQQFQLESERNARQERMFNLTIAPSIAPDSPTYGVDPKTAAASRQAVMKADTDYTKAVNTARTIQQFIDEARAGGPASKAAYALLPTEGSFALSTANGSVRINRNEVQGFSGAGDLWDKVVGKAGKAISGASFSPDVLNSFDALYKGIAANASQKHLEALRNIDNAYRTHWADKITGGMGGPRTFVHNGTTYRNIPAEKVDRFIASHPGAQEQ